RGIGVSRHPRCIRLRGGGPHHQECDQHRAEGFAQHGWSSNPAIPLSHHRMTRQRGLGLANQEILTKDGAAPIRATSSSTRAASPARAVTTVIVGSSRTAMSLKRNEPPHSSDRPTSINQSAPDIALLRDARRTANSIFYRAIAETRSAG